MGNAAPPVKSLPPVREAASGVKTPGNVTICGQLRDKNCVNNQYALRLLFIFTYTKMVSPLRQSLSDPGARGILGPHGRRDAGGCTLYCLAGRGIGPDCQEPRS